MSNYSITKKMKDNFAISVGKTRSSLEREGFGVLTEINVKEKMKQKLDKEMEDYLILGVCDPELASQALDYETEIGLFLPCNVIVYKRNDDVFVSAVLPSVAMSMIENKQLKNVAEKAELKLISVIDNC